MGSAREHYPSEQRPKNSARMAGRDRRAQRAEMPGSKQNLASDEFEQTFSSDPREAEQAGPSSHRIVRATQHFETDDSG